MRRLSMLVMAAALVFGMAQCKKEQPQDPAQGEKVFITLDVNGNNGGSKVNVDPSFGTVTFEQGDKILVGYNGAYVGTLTHDGTSFSGTITLTQSGSQPLYFYFLGNKTPTFDGTTCTVDISDQTQELPVISMAPSNQPYPSNDHHYSAKLRNKCALVEFKLNEGTNENVVVSGLLTQATVNFASPGITARSTQGTIKLWPDASDNAKRWAILLPQTVDASNVTVSINGYNSTIDNIPTAIIEHNAFIHGNDAISITNQASSFVAKDFTVGVVNGIPVKVLFSQGNLQYNAAQGTHAVAGGGTADGTWRFAENQYDYVGNAVGNTAPSSTQSAWIDLFGWGTSGYNHGAVAYQPWSTSTNYRDYFAYGGMQYNNLYDQTGEADWGYNAISNGGNQVGQWRTLTTEEWKYLFATNNEPERVGKYGHGTVRDTPGMILLPDDWTLPSTCTFTSGNSDWSNSYTAEQWAEMESAGAVFLPAAGYRKGTTVYDPSSFGYFGYYWSASYDSGIYAYGVYFYSGSLGSHGSSDRFYGFSVRLVKDVN